jgi:hypothetical protein
MWRYGVLFFYFIFCGLFAYCGYQVSAVGDYTRTDFVHHLNFQKRNGTYYIALWHEVRIYLTYCYLLLIILFFKLWKIALMNVYNVTPYQNLPPAPNMPTLLSFPTKTIISAVEYYWNDNGIMSVGPSNISQDNSSVWTSLPLFLFASFLPSCLTLLLHTLSPLSPLSLSVSPLLSPSPSPLLGT